MNQKNDVLRDNLRRVGVLLRRHGMKSEGNVPSTQNRALSILRLNDGLSQRQLAYVLGIRPQSSGEIVTKMERNGWLTRESDEKDSRINRLFLTEEGRKRAEKIDVMNENDDILDCLDEQEKGQLNDILNKIVEKAYDGDEGEDFEFRMPPRFSHPRMEGKRVPFESSDSLRERPRDNGVFRKPRMEARRMPFREEEEPEEERGFRGKRII